MPILESGIYSYLSNFESVDGYVFSSDSIPDSFILPRNAVEYLDLNYRWEDGSPIGYTAEKRSVSQKMKLVMDMKLRICCVFGKWV